MTTVSRPPAGADGDERPRDVERDESFFGSVLPADLSPRRAARLYVRRLIALAAVAFAILALAALIGLVVVLTTYVGAIGAVSALLAIAAVAGITLLVARKPFVPTRRANRPRSLIGELFVVIPAITVAVAAIGALSQDELRLDFTILAIAGSLVAVFIGMVQAKREQVATTAWLEDSRTTIAFARTFQPMTTALGNVAAARSKADRQKAVEVLITKAIGLAKTMSGSSSGRRSRTRSMYYHLQTEGRLTLRAYEGEYGSPRIEFRAEDSENDRRVIELARGETVLFVNDLWAVAPTYFSNPTGRPYKSLISVPVRAGDKPFGVLMIDAEEANSLTDVDVGYAILIAGLLGAGLAVANMPTSIGPTERADTSYINEFTKTFDSVFAVSFAHAAMSFELTPDDDWKFLASKMTLQTYSRSVHHLADERAERRLDELQRWIRRRFFGVEFSPWAKSTSS